MALSDEERAYLEAPYRPRDVINDYNPVRRPRRWPQRTSMIYIGEGFEGGGANAAHINLILGPKDGPLASAWATAAAARAPATSRSRRC